jgi:hypothetical protein
LYGIFSFHTLIRDELPNRWHDQLYFYRNIPPLGLACIGLAVLLGLTIWGSVHERIRHEGSTNILHERDEMVVSHFMAEGTALVLEIRGSKWSEKEHPDRVAKWVSSVYSLLRLLRPDLAEEFMIEGFPVQTAIPGQGPGQTGVAHFMDRRLWRLKEIHDKIQNQLLATKS